MKQCPNCGKSLQDDALFCSQCGAEIITDGAAGKRVRMETTAQSGLESGTANY